MHAIVSLLPQPIYREVEEIWDQLEQEFGLQGVRPARFPHFSWQGARDYDESALEKTLSRFAAQIHPFKVRTTGLGVFSGVQPVLFIPVIKTRQLADLHRQIWQDLESDGSGINPYYCPDNWTPHISLALTDLTTATIGPVIETLALKTFNWEFEVDNLAHIFISEEGVGGIRIRKDFTG